jgi:hypothetical protein
MEWKNSFAIPEEITTLLKKKGFEVRWYKIAWLLIDFMI